MVNDLIIWIILQIIFALFFIIILYIGYLIFFKFIKKRFEENKTVMLCPNCGSGNLQSTDLWLGPFRPAKFRCISCSYEGIFVEVDKNKIKEFRNKINRKKKRN